MEAVGESEALLEQVFAKLELLLRKAAERTVEATWQRIDNCSMLSPLDESANYLRNSGYASIRSRQTPDDRLERLCEFVPSGRMGKGGLRTTAPQFALIRSQPTAPAKH